MSADMVAETLERLNPAALAIVEIDEAQDIWEVGAHFTDEPHSDALALVEAAFGCSPFVVSEVPERDWVAHVERNLAPVLVGRFWVCAGQRDDQPPPAAVPIRIRSSMAFGTGHHGSTQGCLKALDQLIQDGSTLSRCADIGCGTGILSLAAALSEHAEVIASDADPIALESARANISANRCEQMISCVEATGLDHLTSIDNARFDVIFINIVSDVVIALVPRLRTHLAPAGHAILSGLLADQVDEVLAASQQSGLDLVHRCDIMEWSSLTMGL